MKKQKISLRNRVTGIYILIMAVVILMVWVTNNWLLPRYYMNYKVKVLEHGYQAIDSMMNRRELDGQGILEEVQEELKKVPGFGDRRNKDRTQKEESETSLSPQAAEIIEVIKDLRDTSNISLYVYDTMRGNEIIASSREKDQMRMRLLSYILGFNENETAILKEYDNYVIQRTYDSFRKNYTIESWGYFSDNGTVFLMSTPVDSIREGASISTMFLTRVGLVAMIIGSIIIYLATGVIDRLYEANEKLQKDIDEKNRIDEMRKEFIANVSHELKTPIALIQGYAEGLCEGMAEDPDSRDYYCNVIQDEALKMNKMVKQLITLSELEYGADKPEIEEFDLAYVIQSCIETAGIMIRQKGVNVEFHQEEPVTVLGDEFKIEEVITNYLSNALNHVNDEKEIKIKLENVNRDGKALTRVEVFNSGDNIPDEVLENIWTKFYKADKSRSRAYGGSGIGLSIVKAIMEGHGMGYGAGNVNGGVIFWFELPRA